MELNDNNKENNENKQWILSEFNFESLILFLKDKPYFNKIAIQIDEDLKYLVI
jgi:hypothetical protein